MILHIDSLKQRTYQSIVADVMRYDASSFIIHKSDIYLTVDVEKDGNGIKVIFNNGGCECRLGTIEKVSGRIYIDYVKNTDVHFNTVIDVSIEVKNLLQCLQTRL